MEAATLEERIGYRFKKRTLLRQALTHRSHGQPNNERLEFLGDSVLNCAIATVLFDRFPNVDEGDLSRLRAYLVKQQALHKVAQRLALGEHLVLGEGESRSGGTRRPSILADALEALIGAVYLDSGFQAAQSVIDRLYEPELKDADPLTLGKDAKTLLQEQLQRDRMPLPVYAVVATHGAAHNQMFEVECVIQRMEIRVLGSGKSRRAAEQAAAESALEALALAEKANKVKPKQKPRKSSAKKRSAKKQRAPKPPVNGSKSPRSDVSEKANKGDKAIKPDKADKASKPAKPGAAEPAMAANGSAGTAATEPAKPGKAASAENPAAGKPATGA